MAYACPSCESDKTVVVLFAEEGVVPVSVSAVCVGAALAARAGGAAGQRAVSDGGV
jgi:hypothetical protein